MARQGFFSRLFSSVRDVVSPASRRERREQERRDFARGRRTRERAARDEAQRARDELATRNARAARRRQERRERENAETRPFREEWEDQGLGQATGRRGSARRFRGNYGLFKSIPGINQEDEEEQLDLWNSYVENMIKGNHPYRFNDIRNPFWADANMMPRDFDWDEWRRWHDTP